MDSAAHKEKLLSGLGGVFSIAVVFWITTLFETTLQSRSFFVASMGATAVLLFAAPRVQFAQPWNVIGGHVISALIGVSVHKLIGDPIIAGALAVGLAISAMYYTNSLHPPGGATALMAVIGGSTVDGFGYLYAIVPVGLGAVLMTLIAIAVNYPFAYRRYPEALFHRSSKRSESKIEHDPAYPDISHADLVTALAQIDSFVDISEEDLLRIYELATQREHPAISNQTTRGPESLASRAK